MSHTTDSVGWPRLIIVLTAALGLAFATVPAASAQDEDESAVACDAEAFEEDGDVLYLVEPGQEVECEAFGLEPEEEAEWWVEFFDLLDDPDVPVDDDGDVDVATEDGTLTFAFVVPDDIVLGMFFGEVFQGDEQEPDYLEEFAGLIFGIGPMTCDPDPVTQGENVECIAEEMDEGEFDWMVSFLTMDEFLGLIDEEDDDVLDAFEPDIEGSGTADSDGVGVFDFDVPLEGDIEVYLVFAEQGDDYLAVYAGDVEAAPPAPEPVDEEEDDAPVVVPRPERVDTGGGGAAPGSNPPAGLLLIVTAGLVAATAYGARHQAMRGR